MIENDPLACRLIKQNMVNLSAQQIKIIQSDVFKFLASDASPYNLVFLDPPFNKSLAQQTCHWLEDKGWLTLSAKIYLEVESELVLNDIPANWQCLKSKKSGEVGFYLFGRDLS